MEWPDGGDGEEIVLNAEESGRGTEKGTQAVRAVADDTVIEVVLCCATVQNWREEGVEGGVSPREEAEMTRWENIGDGENQFIRDSGDGHDVGEDVERVSLTTMVWLLKEDTYALIMIRVTLRSHIIYRKGKQVT